MDKERALEIQALRAEQVVGMAAVLGSSTAAAEVTSALTFSARYHDIHTKLTSATSFFQAGEGYDAWEVTPAIRVAQGTPPLPDIRLRFMRMPAFRHDSAPSTIVAQWCHSPENGGAVGDSPDPFAVLGYGEVFASECVTSAETMAADDGEPFPPMAGSDPRSLEERMALLEQSVEEFIASLPEPTTVG